MACCMSSMGSFEVTSTPVTGAIDELRQMQDGHLKYVSETMCQWAAPEYGNPGEDWEKTVWQAALVAMATINTAAQISIMEKRYEIAKAYANIAKDKWERFRDNYAPLERSMLSEISAEVDPTPDYDGAASRGNEYATLAFQSGSSTMAHLAKKYAICIDSTQLNDFDFSKFLSIVDGQNFNYRDEEWFALTMSDIRWNRRSSLLNLGRDLHSQSASYASAANNLLAGLGNLAAEGAAGATQLLGYLSERRDTAYPEQFSAASPLTNLSNESFGQYVTTGPVT